MFSPVYGSRSRVLYYLYKPNETKEIKTMYQVKTGDRILFVTETYQEASKLAEKYYLETNDDNVYVTKELA